MALELKKALPVTLRSVGLNEKWLQDQIQNDPSLLGLGELEIAGREHRQPVGGRIDFLMRNVEANTYYEIELMLGAVDESHIVRTIEYWDIERQRRPKYEHRAVIVAEEITARFFNVLRLLNRAVPLIAIKISAFQTNDQTIILHPVTVLDIIDEIAEDHVVEQTERADRALWQKKSPLTLSVVDKIVSLLKDQNINARMTYNRMHIALGAAGRNFCWFYHRKLAGRCFVSVRIGSEAQDSFVTELQTAGIDVTIRDNQSISFGITLQELEGHSNIIVSGLKQAEEASR